MTVATGRQQWAVQTMAIEPGDRVLEIGCGRGVAAGLVCQHLTTGRLVAIDRSAAMVSLARERNAVHVGSGRAEFRAGSVESADLEAHTFDKVFAVNVSLFWMGTSSGSIEAVKRLLARSGVLHVFHETIDPLRAKAIAARIATTLTQYGFHASVRAESPIVWVTARLPAG